MQSLWNTCCKQDMQGQRAWPPHASIQLTEGQGSLNHDRIENVSSTNTNTSTAHQRTWQGMRVTSQPSSYTSWQMAHVVHGGLRMSVHDRADAAVAEAFAAWSVMYFRILHVMHDSRYSAASASATVTATVTATPQQQQQQRRQQQQQGQYRYMYSPRPVILSYHDCGNTASCAAGGGIHHRVRPHVTIL